MTRELYVLALVKGTERFLFLFDDRDDTANELLQQFGRLAADPDVSFTWYDAAVLSQKLRRLIDERRHVGDFE